MQQGYVPKKNNLEKELQPHVFKSRKTRLHIFTLNLEHINIFYNIRISAFSHFLAYKYVVVII